MSQSHGVGERRPIRTRDLAMAQRAARMLAATGITPNAISVAGMVAAAAAGWLFAATSAWPDFARGAWLLGAVLVQARLLANMFDGMVALERGSASPVGELYNEVPDRFSDAFILIGMGYAAGGNATWGYLAALAAVFTAYVRAMAKVAGAPQDFCGPFAKPQRMFVVTITALYLGLSPALWQPLWDWPVGGGIPAAALAVVAVGSLVTAVRRLLRAARFLERDQG